jgi:hypothetical protein
MTNKTIKFFEDNFNNSGLCLAYSADLQGRILLTGQTIDDKIASFSNWEDCHKFLQSYI